MLKMKKFLIVFLLPLCWSLSVAQDNIIDEVIWLVGDEAILRSDVEKERLNAQYNGTPIEGDPYCVIPEQLAIQKLFLHQAELDSIVVSESAVINQVDMQLNYYISQIGSKEKMEEYFRQSYSEIREDLRDAVRNQQIIQQMQNKLVENITCTPAELRRFYNTVSPDSIPTIPSQVEVQILSIYPPIPPEETERVKERLREFTERINTGDASFSILARLYSEDMESSVRGGELGFMGRGQLVPEFANVAFNLTDPNRVSRIVETEFGYHIIQLIEKRGDRINCRHILLRPKVLASDKKKALNQLDSIANLVRTEKMTYQQAVAYFSQDKNTVMNSGLMMNQKTGTSKFEYQDLPQEVAKVVYSMNVGEISAPFVMMDEATNKEVCAIVRLKSKVDTHKADLTNDYQTLKQFLENKKKNEFIRNWIATKQKETYISIDPKWRGCDFMYPGWIK